MKNLRHTIMLTVALATFGAPLAASAQQAKEEQTITAVGQTLTNSEGTWALKRDGSTTSGYAVTLNGKDVGYAVKLTLNREGLPVATHADGSVWNWTGSTFKRAQ
jgi:lipopolysaccharide export LptBFGC system permease protein LptF